MALGNWTLVLYFPLLGYLLFWGWRRSPEPLRVYLGVGVVLRVVCSVLLGWLYAHHWGGGDTWRYYQDALRLLELAESDFSSYLSAVWVHELPGVTLKGRGLFTAWLYSIPIAVAGQQYYFAAAMIAILSWLGIVELIRSVYQAQQPVWGWVFALLCWPSIVFWSSGMLKEALLLGLGSWIVSLIYRSGLLPKRKKIRLLPMLLIGFWLLWQVKYYVAGVALAALGAAYCASLFTHRRWSAVVYLAVWGGLLGMATLSYPPIHPTLLLQTLYANYQQILAMSSEVGIVQFSAWDGTLHGALVSMPRALLASMVQPWPGHSWNLWSFLSSLENTVLLGLLGLSALYSLRYPKTILGGNASRYWYISAILFVVVMAMFVGLSTPNLGTLVRYRVAYLPFLLVWMFNQLTRKRT